MKIKHKIMASAIAFAVGLSSASAATTTNSWWSVDFDSGYTDNGALNGVIESGEGTWSKTGDDVSSMVDLAGESLAAATSPAAPVTNIGKINTQTGSLVWTPAGGISASTKVLVDADVYLVGSDEAPTTVIGTDVQTEVYLNTAGDSPYLYAHVNISSVPTWQKLEGIAISDQSWVRLRIEMDYTTTSAPKVLFYVNNMLMDDGADLTAFDVLNVKTGVSSVSFLGTGYLDNFVGQKVETLPSGPTFSDGGVNTNGTAAAGTGMIEEEAGVVNATFASSVGSDNIQFVQMTGPNGYVRSVRTADGDVSFSTVGLPAGTYSITGYYGDVTLTTGLPAPAAATVGENKAAEVVEELGVKKLSVTVAPKSGLYYTLFVGSTPASLTAGANSVLASPADQDAGFIKMAMPVPTQANGVNIIKIYASDESYVQGASAP